MDQVYEPMRVSWGVWDWRMQFWDEAGVRWRPLFLSVPGVVLSVQGAVVRPNLLKGIAVFAHGQSDDYARSPCVQSHKAHGSKPRGRGDSVFQLCK